MPLVFAAITPHPPVLIPEIGKENVSKLAKTKSAMEKLERELYASQPESLLIISPHGKTMADDFTINLAADYTVHFQEFGDFGVELKFRSDYLSIQQIRAADEGQRNVPLVLSSTTEIDHGFGVPLHYLTSHQNQLPIIPVTSAASSLEQHFAFGKFLHRQLSSIDKRFAVVASADLSHRLTQDAPGGYSKRGSEFDKKLVSLVKKNDVAAILKFDRALAEEAGECGLRPIAMLLGILEAVNVSVEALSYERPFGVGYLVANFKFS